MLEIKKSVRTDVESMLSTGTYSNGRVRPNDGGNTDQNWVVSYTSHSYAAHVIKNHGAWLANNHQSKWVGAPDGARRGYVGHYIFTNTFDMWGYDPRTTDIVMHFSVDDTIRSMTLNGKALPLPDVRHSYRRFGNPYILRGWRAGYNTLEVDVYNGGGPVALRVLAKGLCICQSYAL